MAKRKSIKKKSVKKKVVKKQKKQKRVVKKIKKAVHKLVKKVSKKPVKKTKVIKKFPVKIPAAKEVKQVIEEKPAAAVGPNEKQIGVITHYFNHISVGIIKLDDELKKGDVIHIKGVHDDITQTIESMQYNHQDISVGQKGMEIGIKVVNPVHEHDKVYLVNK